MSHTLKPNDIDPEEFEKLLDSGKITIDNKNEKLELVSKWKCDNKNYWIIKIAKDDYSIFDGVGVLDCTFTSLKLAEDGMRSSGATRIFKI